MKTACDHLENLANGECDASTRTEHRFFSSFTQILQFPTYKIAGLGTQFHRKLDRRVERYWKSVGGARQNTIDFFP